VKKLTKCQEAAVALYWSHHSGGGEDLVSSMVAVLVNECPKAGMVLIGKIFNCEIKSCLLADCSVPIKRNKPWKWMLKNNARGIIPDLFITYANEKENWWNTIRQNPKPTSFIVELKWNPTETKQDIRKLTINLGNKRLNGKNINWEALAISGSAQMGGEGYPFREAVDAAKKPANRSKSHAAKIAIAYLQLCTNPKVLIEWMTPHIWSQFGDHDKIRFIADYLCRSATGRECKQQVIGNSIKVDGVSIGDNEISIPFDNLATFKRSLRSVRPKKCRGRVVRVKLAENTHTPSAYAQISN
jgi:hypothetical protein